MELSAITTKKDGFKKLIVTVYVENIFSVAKKFGLSNSKLNPFEATWGSNRSLNESLHWIYSISVYDIMNIIKRKKILHLTLNFINIKKLIIFFCIRRSF